MRSKHNLNPDKSLFEADKDTQLHHFLQAVPFLTYSDKVLINIARRFCISAEDLKQHIADFETREGWQNG